MARREADAEADTDADADANADAERDAGAEAEAESDLVSGDRGDAGAASDLGEAEGDLVAPDAADAAGDLGEADRSAGDLGAPSLARAVLARGLGLTLGPAQPIGASRAPSTSSAVRIERARAW